MDLSKEKLLHISCVLAFFYVLKVEPVWKRQNSDAWPLPIQTWSSWHILVCILTTFFSLNRNDMCVLIRFHDEGRDWSILVASSVWAWFRLDNKPIWKSWTLSVVFQLLVKVCWWWKWKFQQFYQFNSTEDDRRENCWVVLATVVCRDWRKSANRRHIVFNLPAEFWRSMTSAMRFCCFLYCEKVEKVKLFSTANWQRFPV